MKAIIARKKYDTETAKMIVQWDNGHFGGHYRRCCETLYKTVNGAYFLHGDGGAMTQYGRMVGNMRAPGEEIRPLTETEALDWLQDRGFPDAAEEHFKDQIQDA